MFLLLAEVLDFPPGTDSSVSLTSFLDEDEFLHNAVLATSRHEVLVEIVTNVLLAAAGKRRPGAWLSVDVSLEELNGMGLKFELEPIAAH